MTFGPMVPERSGSSTARPLELSVRVTVSRGAFVRGLQRLGFMLGGYRVIRIFRRDIALQ